MPASTPPPQQVVSIGNVTLGGHLGEHPTCMIGTMFYKSHGVIVDKSTGQFNEDEATTQLRDMETVSRETGIPFIVDVVGNTAENLARYCRFVADATEDPRQPFLLDGLDDTMRLSAMKDLVDAGLARRMVYNSIEPRTSTATLDHIKEAGLPHAMLLAFDSTMLLPRQKLQLLHGWGDMQGIREGLLAKASRAGITDPLVDVAVLDMPSIGLAARAIQDVRVSTGHPAGCAPSNAIFECEALKRKGLATRLGSLAASCAFLASHGASFILFGPVKHARVAFEAVAYVNAYQAYAGRRIDKIKPGSEKHPLFTMF